MIHVTVGIAQFFVILLTQMAIVAGGLIAVGAIGCAGVFLIFRSISKRRAEKRKPEA